MGIKQIQGTSGVVTATVLNTKINEVENILPNTSNLVLQMFWIQKLVKLQTKFLVILKI